VIGLEAAVIVGLGDGVTLAVADVDDAGAGGQQLPARAGVVHVRHGLGDTLAEADDHGRFQADHIPRGPLGLRIDVRVDGGSATVTTDWIAR